MFTGLVGSTGVVRRLEPDANGARIEVATPLSAELRPGDSIAVNGVCVTAVTAEDGAFRADLVAETLRRSSLGPLREGEMVNLELPLRADERLGGHFVQGHIDGVGTVAEIREEGSSRVARIECDESLSRYVVEKGSIAVDGVSLTVAGLTPSGFEVALIPETLERTTFGSLEAGRRVNLEVDVLAKYVERLAARA
jgi:riboflavin synthase